MNSGLCWQPFNVNNSPLPHMPDSPPFDRDVLRAIAGTVHQRLNLPYSIHVCESDPLVVGFALLDHRGALRATAMVSRTSEMCAQALLVGPPMSKRHAWA